MSTLVIFLFGSPFVTLQIVSSQCFKYPLRYRKSQAQKSGNTGTTTSSTRFLIIIVEYLNLIIQYTNLVDLIMSGTYIPVWTRQRGKMGQQRAHRHGQIRLAELSIISFY